MMKIILQEFVESLIEQSIELRAVYQESVEYWAPDVPPITIILGELGRQIVDGLNDVEPEVNRRIFQLIEAAMKSADGDLQTAVASGLIEAIVTRTDQDEHVWEIVSSMLGELSRKHAESWKSWGKK